MFRCQRCGAVTPPRTSSQILVVETRERAYPARREACRAVEWNAGRRRVIKKDDPGGTGREIVRELRVCPACKAAHEAS